MNTLEDVLAVLAHEMRTPIAAILGYQELLAEGIYGAIDARGKEGLERIAYSARQLLHLIDGVQELGLPATKRLAQEVMPFEPAGLLRACVANANADANGRDVRIDAQVPEALPELTGDPDRFCRAIDLALSAAVKVSHGATLALTASAENGALSVVVANTGLSPEQDDPKFVAESKRKLTGAGLRLAIARAIASQMHGDLQLRPTGDTTAILLEFRGVDRASGPRSD